MQVEKDQAITSLKNLLWQEKEYNKTLKNDLEKQLGISDFQAQILAARKDDIPDFNNFLNPTLRSSLPDPLIIKDMDKAAHFVAKAIAEKKRIAIFGDYDADGATSSALLKNFLKHFGLDARIYIPDRIMEGYGPNINALLKLKEEGHDLVITVDCGTTAIDPLEEAAKHNLDIIVVDHHLSKNLKPKAIAIVNPNRDDDESNLTYLAGVGVCFMMLIAVNRILRENGYYEKQQLKEINLLTLLDLVALGTVCDCVPLIALNRALVTQGLKILNQRQNPGLNHLLTVSSLEEKEIEPYHLGFMLGPRINAGGRVGKSSLAAEMLTSDKPDDLRNISQKLDIHNQERQAIEAIALEEAEELILNQALHEEAVIIAAAENWHPGVIGIVAARIKEKFQKPTMIIAIGEDGIGKASCRSHADINIGEIVTLAKEAGILKEGGGHKMAAGFSILPEKIKALREYIKTHYQKQIEEELANQKLYYDYHCSLEKIGQTLYEEIQALQPFGMGNPEPIFAFHNLVILKSMLLGKNHIKLIIAELSGGSFGKSSEAIAWKAADSTFGEYLLKGEGKQISLAATIKENIWQNQRRFQLNIVDVQLK